MDTTYFNHPRRFPKNVTGPFYTTGLVSQKLENGVPKATWCGDCLWCGAPESEAPQLFAPLDETYTDTYFVKQPTSPIEIQQAIRAAQVCCVFAVRYGGKDHKIISALKNDPNCCDYIIDKNGILKCTVDTNGDFLPFAQKIIDKMMKKKKWWQFWR